MSDKKQHWITRLVPALAFAAGIIITSIGGIMTTSSAMKLAFFENGPYNYVTEESCRYDYNKPYSKVDDKPYERTEAEIAVCMEEKKQEELTRFQNSEKQDIIEGVSALIVGGILLLAFRRRK